MLPLYDENRSHRRPWVNWFLIAVNAVVFLYEFMISRGFTDPRPLVRFFLEYGALPAQVLEAVSTFDLSGLAPLLTSMFVHGGYLHIGGNMLFLYIFGDNVEDRFGHLGYLVIYVLFGVAAGLAHSYLSFLQDGVRVCTRDLLLEVSTCTPAVGASGAISGVLGAYLVFFPGARIVTLLWSFYFIRLLRIPALVYLPLWFFLEVLRASVTLGFGLQSEVAFGAHIGGFIAGFIVAVFARGLGAGRHPVRPLQGFE